MLVECNRAETTSKAKSMRLSDTDTDLSSDTESAAPQDDSELPGRFAWPRPRELRPGGSQGYRFSPQSDIRGLGPSFGRSGRRWLMPVFSPELLVVCAP